MRYEIPSRFIASLVGCVMLFVAVSCDNACHYRCTIVHSEGLSDSLLIAVQDIGEYISRSIPKGSVEYRYPDSAFDRNGDVIVLVDRSDSALVSLCSEYGLDVSPKEWNSFVISCFGRKDAEGMVYFLEGADLWGRQYAAYDFLEHYLGVRYLKPDHDHVPVFRRFKSPEINTGIQKPDYKWRGLYPWHYNYGSRGLHSFCDINARFVAQDWDWFCSLADWMVKNKQNVVLWFDDVFSHENISGQFPDSVTDYYALRGIRQVLGMGWASNEDRNPGFPYKEIICVDEHGKSIETEDWRRAICPESDAYFKMADKNFANMKLDKPENYLGVLIGYAENSWAAYESGVNCVHHKGVPSSSLMLRDLKYVKEKFEKAGLGHLPVGYVTSTHSIHPGNPFESDAFLDGIDDNAIFTMHTYQQSAWTQFERLYDRIKKKNDSEGADLKVFHIGEVAFICGADIPLLKPSIIRRRSEHFNSLPKENTIGHLATLNTTQFLYWYKTYQMMRWQWHKDDARWDEDNYSNFAAVFGDKDAIRINEIFNRFACLEYVLPYSQIDSLKHTVADLRPPVQWGRYNAKTHPNEFGFLLWADVKDMDQLCGAEESIGQIRALNEELKKGKDQFYNAEFYPIIRLTADYYSLRIHYGKYLVNMSRAEEAYAASGWSETVRTFLSHAGSELSAAKADLDEYNEIFYGLINLDLSAVSDAKKADVDRDFVFNPDAEYIASKLNGVRESLRENKLMIK